MCAGDNPAKVQKTPTTTTMATITEMHVNVLQEHANHVSDIKDLIKIIMVAGAIMVLVYAIVRCFRLYRQLVPAQ